jgi:FkbM family methyltransferase
VGANIGTYSLWLSRQCVPQGKVYAFEIAPVTLERLRDNLLLNNIKNVEVVPAACADRVGPLDFFIGRHHHSNSLSAEWSGGGQCQPQKLVVDGVTLDDFFYGGKTRPAPAFIKMDIEGGGVFALKGCRLVCDKARPVFLIESHTPAEDSAIRTIITDHNYKAFRIETHTWITRPDEIYPHPDGVWGNVFLCPAEKCGTLEPLIGRAG